MKVHELKILPEYYKAIMHMGKSFELRKDDRGFEVGDRLRLRKYDTSLNSSGEPYGYTGEVIVATITYILRDVPQYGLRDGYAILGLGRIREEYRRPG